MKIMVFILGVVLFAPTLAQTCNTHIIADTPTSRFIINEAQGTAVDKKTGLMWRRDLLSTGFPSQWKTALVNAQASSFAGYKDWRVPNLKELSSIVEASCSNPALNTAVFPGVTAYSPGIWSSTQKTGSGSAAGYAWVVDFSTGHTASYNKQADMYVLFVRGGQ